MRGATSVAAGIVLLTGTALAQPQCPPRTATLTVFVDNRTGTTVDVHVEGQLAADAVTCVGAGAISYQPMLPLQCAPGRGVCGTIEGLRPGAWVHRVAVRAPESDSTQEQAQRTIVAVGDPIASNVVVWTVYPKTFVVTTSASDDSSGSLRAALEAAASSAASGPVLVTFSGEFQGADAPRTIDLDGGRCDPDTHHAGICFRGSGIVVDGLDRNAAPGAVVWSVGARNVSLLRVYGSDNVFRGLVFSGSQTPIPDPTMPCDAQGFLQVDSVAFTGPDARGNAIEQSVVLGPSCGDGISVDSGAIENAVRASRIAGAQDRGLKADSGSVTIAGSCVHDNGKGGIQATLGGNVVAEANVVQRNLGGSGQNGLTAIDTCRDDNLGCQHDVRCMLTTRGNIVRFSGGRGLSVRDNAEATFDSDYVANNLVKGAEVETRDTVPVDGNGTERVPSASFHGVGLVCNYSDGVEGVGAETRLDVGHDPPSVSYGDATHPGRNAFSSNRGNIAGAGANFLLTNVTTPISAEGNQWGNCSGTVCDEETIRTLDIRPASPSNANVALVEPGTTFAGARAGAPMVYQVAPTRPHAGEVVRIYGDDFDAINGNPTRDVCPSMALPPCSPEGTCSAGPCVDGTCPCAIDNDAVQARNTATQQAPKPPNRIRIRANDTQSSLLADLAPDAVTPTMLVFRIPFDCFAPMTLEVLKYGVVERTFLCDPTGCQDQPPETPCDDGDPSTVGDRCDGEGQCVGDPVSTTSTITIAPSTSSIVPSTTTTTMTAPTSSTTPAPSTTTSTTEATTTTLLTVCNVTLPSSGDVAACSEIRPRSRASRLLRSIERVLAKGRQPKCRRVRLLETLVGKCKMIAPRS